MRAAPLMRNLRILSEASRISVARPYTVNADFCSLLRQKQRLQLQIRPKTIGGEAGCARHGANAGTPAAEAAALSLSSSVASGRPRRKASSR